MSQEFMALLAGAALLFALAIGSTAGIMSQHGLRVVVGNREDMPDVTGWPGRGRRAHANLLENLVLFAIVVLVADAMDVSNNVTVVGAWLFFSARCVHAAVYLAGSTSLRALAFWMGNLGTFMIASQLF